MMYLEHFGLNQQPFSLTPNTQFFLKLSTHIEAMQVLQIALQQGEGFIKVTGEVGTGKTLLCHQIIGELPSDFQSIYLPDPYLTPDELRWAVALELGLIYKEQTAQQQLTSIIQAKLISLHQAGKKLVLIVDEAQAIPTESLEALRLLTNLETETTKLLQVVLFGQPEIDERLNQPQLRQLRQRITFSYQLRQLSKHEVSSYLQHRLYTAGYHGKTLFSHTGVKLLYKASRGIPRLVNILAHKALLLSYGKGQSYVSKKHIQDAIADTDDAQDLSYINRSYMLLGFGLTLGLITMLGGLLL